MTSPPSTDKRIKLIVTGPVGVGKTSVLEYFVLNKFQRFMDSTIGATFHTKDMYIDEQKYPTKYGTQLDRNVTEVYFHSIIDNLTQYY